MKKKEKAKNPIPRKTPPVKTEEYIFVIYAMSGIGGQVYLGTIRGRHSWEMDELCLDLAHKLREFYPRGISYHMMSTNIDMEEALSLGGSHALELQDS